ncbi:MAG: peptidase M22 [Bacillota bacterium]
MNAFLGIDTSAYTTSVAIVGEKGEVLADERMLLQVASGKRGLRQSEAHFQHMRNLPVLMEKLAPVLKKHRLLALGVSDQPRRHPDSYMPVFLAGLGVCRCLASVGGYPLYFFSHQEGHVEAAAHGFPLEGQDFIAVHFSGGTSEILLVKRDVSRYRIDLILATKDLNAGQLVDRVGVAMGLPFPSGSHMEQIAKDTATDHTLPSSVDKQGFSFSGAETRAVAMLAQGVPQETVSYLVFKCIANTLEKGLRMAAEHSGITRVVMAGGVMANGIIRNRLAERFRGSKIKLYWAPPDLSTDNAVGIAFLARKFYYYEHEMGVYLERQ